MISDNASTYQSAAEELTQLNLASEKYSGNSSRNVLHGMVDSGNDSLA